MKTPPIGQTIRYLYKTRSVAKASFLLALSLVAKVLLAPFNQSTKSRFLKLPQTDRSTQSISAQVLSYKTLSPDEKYFGIFQNGELNFSHGMKIKGGPEFVWSSDSRYIGMVQRDNGEVALNIIHIESYCSVGLFSGYSEITLDNFVSNAVDKKITGMDAGLSFSLDLVSYLDQAEQQYGVYWNNQSDYLNFEDYSDKKISAWQTEFQVRVPHSQQICYFHGFEMTMGGPTVGTLFFDADFRINTGASLAIEPTGRFLACTSWQDVSGTQSQYLLIIDIKNKTLVRKIGPFVVLEIESFRDGIIDILIDPLLTKAKKQIDLQAVLRQWREGQMGNKYCWDNTKSKDEFILVKERLSDAFGYSCKTVSATQKSYYFDCKTFHRFSLSKGLLKAPTGEIFEVGSSFVWSEDKRFLAFVLWEEEDLKQVAAVLDTTTDALIFKAAHTPDGRDLKVIELSDFYFGMLRLVRCPNYYAEEVVFDLWETINKRMM